MRTSIFESIPINLVIDTCWVLDPTTYFKGRPINSDEQHVYICEYKVDKQARVFSVIKKSSRTPISIKPYAFYKFEEQLRQKRNHLVGFLVVRSSSLIDVLFFTATRHRPRDTKENQEGASYAPEERQER